VLLALGMLGAVGVALLGLDRLPITVCYFKALSGLPCMSCGGTRAVAALARLDPGAALASNPLATLGGLALVPWGLGDLLLWPRGRALRLSVAPPLRPGLRLAVLAAVTLNWAYLIAAGR
jgi:hypothetical protein